MQARPGAPPPTAAARAAGVHPIVELGYRVRAPAHLCTLLMLASIFIATGATPVVWALVLFYGLVWPHLGRFIAGRSRDGKAAELRNLLVDSGLAGAFVALSGFSLWPSVVLITGFNSACLSVGGVGFALRAFTVGAVSAAVAGALVGYRFTPDSTLVTSIICALSLLGYTMIFSLRTHVEAKRLLGAQRELRATAGRMEEQRRKVEHALELAEAANRAKSAFLANMSHELRTPLNAIIGYAEMLEEDIGDTAQRADLQRIYGSGKHLLGLINDVLDLSRIEAGKIELHPETFDIAQLVDQVVSTVRPLFEKNANRFGLRLADGVGVMNGDARRLRQVLSNLLSNAAKFTEQGTVTLAVTRLLADESAGTGARVAFEVADTGIGMTAAQVDKLFVPFMQADAQTTRKYGGTGLGLAIARRVSDLLGGTIEVRSEPGRGSTFTLTVPADASLSAPAAPAAPESLPPPTR